MVQISATEAKNHFGKWIDAARREAVSIEKQGRPVAVLLSQEEYVRLNELEDLLLSLQAENARKEGFLSERESQKLLDDLLNA
jgi:antitoxin Phd